MSNTSYLSQNVLNIETRPIKYFIVAIKLNSPTTNLSIIAVNPLNKDGVITSYTNGVHWPVITGPLTVATTIFRTNLVNFKSADQYYPYRIPNHPEHPGLSGGIRVVPARQVTRPVPLAASAFLIPYLKNLLKTPENGFQNSCKTGNPLKYFNKI